MGVCGLHRESVAAGMDPGHGPEGALRLRGATLLAILVPSPMRRIPRPRVLRPAELAPGLSRRLAFACHAGLVLALAASTSEAAQARLTEPAGVRSGRLDAWREGRPVVDGAAAASDWLGLELGPAEPDAGGPPPPWTLELADGSRLPGAPGLGGGELGAWRLPSGIELTFDSLWLRGAGRRPLPAVALDKDELWLRNALGEPDRLRGWLLGWQPDGLEFDGPAGEVRFPWDRIEGIQVLAEEAPPRAGSGWVWLVLRGGGFCAVRPRDGLGSEPLRAELPWGGMLELDWGLVAALHPLDQAGFELSALPFVAARQPSSEVLDWSAKRGRSVLGGPLRVAGREFPDGFGVRAPSELAFEIPAGGRFAAWIGMDDEVAGFRHAQPVRFLLFLGEDELARSAAVTAGEPARMLQAEVPRAGLLRLVVEPEGRLPFGTHANWLLPRLLPAVPAPG